mmetsp:Transcript_4413/g.8876  ORF Transcript_4413/g.8876 Transcript_4413/m.8876 type:complete len:172 (-) Transcript_4413:448-963(-)
MACYEAIRSRSVRPQGAVRLAEKLGKAAVKGHPWWVDGMHFNQDGLVAAFADIEEVLKELQADGIVSDSTLCAGRSDRWGELAKKHCSKLATPCWGASFCGGAFGKAIYGMWNHDRKAMNRIIVMVAGNDLHPGASAKDIGDEMDSIRTYWATGDVKIIYVDVVPAAYRKL